ncbi:Bug family tripartite tricarboxylate transporter substrate binding protein [Bradyrhizobium glycinis]|uniref:Bug family tripartite tricarboxylate transporter substrate binding protein n=1 Tax=Bradyrhizobium glycinis TaxID=2751812 RepID=UPI0018D75193|nr:tripartite tricarboxylate transporter substrate binding protein [Bradyrhizobium glycinis]MBH5369140.1 tripartite tricarboxylate transporter substrate binding protein [Bradyrhizobium glycinis]
MLMRRRAFVELLAAAAALPALSPLAHADDYPSRPVRLVVGFPEGGPVDIAARVIAGWLSDRLSQPVVVENQPGESGNVATRSVARAKPDGYSLLVCGPVNTINATLFKNLDFDFGRDFVPVAGLWQVPLVIEVNPSVPATTLASFIAHAKANPGKLKIGFAGAGTPQHIGIEMFKVMADVDLTLVPYLGSTPALADLLAGKIDCMFDPMPSSIAHIKAGRLIPLAVTTPVKSAALPDVPSASDFVPGYQAISWFGIVAPREMPAVLVEKLNQAINAAFADTRIMARLAELGASPLPGSPTQFQAFIQSEMTKYAEVIRVARIAPR